MAQRYQSRFRLALVMLGGLFLLLNGLTVTLLILTRSRSGAAEPLLLALFLLVCSIGLPIVALLTRRLLRPSRQLIAAAERAPVAKRALVAGRDETEFVLETFQNVVAQLQSQSRQLENLRAAASARADSAEKFSERIVASVPSGLIAFGAEGRARMVNQAAGELIGRGDHPAGENQLVRELLSRAPELAEMVEHCLRTGELRRREEFSLKSSDGNLPRKIGATVAPIDFAREDRGALCLLTDLTEVIELREAVALKKNLENLGEMSAGLAHELKNSLAALHGYAQLLQQLSAGDESRRTAAGAMLQEVRNLSEMVTSFLNFARPQPLNLEIVALRELLDECATELRELFRARGVELVLTGEWPTVSVDERMLRQALLNVLRNAAEAIDEGQSARRVTAVGSLQQDARGKNWSVIEVADTGDGIPPEDLSRIFIPFFTTKSKGYGVGLALAHRVITEHGGSISAANAEIGGARLTIKLPLE